jgi:hypothetical protein
MTSFVLKINLEDNSYKQNIDESLFLHLLKSSYNEYISTGDSLCRFRRTVYQSCSHTLHNGLFHSNPKVFCLLLFSQHGKAVYESPFEN